MVKKAKMVELVKKNINLPINLVNDIKIYSKNNGLDFTSSVIVLLNESINFYKQQQKKL